jgi:hypothetical protein
VADPLPLRAVRQAFVTPFVPVSEAVVTPFSRTLFFGGPFTALCLIGCVLFARRHTELTLTVLASGLLLFTTLTVVPFVSARFQFRDPLIVAAIPLAGLVVDRLFARRGTAVIAAVVLSLQAGVMIWAALPFLKAAWSEEAREAFWFRAATASHETVDRLIALMPARGRMALTPDVDRDVFSRGGLNAGLGINAFAYRGVPVVNGWFKGVSTATVWPDERVFYGRARIPTHIVTSDAALDVLGVRYVLGNGGEAVAGGLRVVGEIPAGGDNPALVLYENPDRWPEAFLVDAGAESYLPSVDGCDHPVVLCRNFDVLVSRRLDTPLRVRERGGALDVRILRAPVPRLLVVTQMFRPGWVATAAGARLETVSLYGGLLGVRVPPEVDQIELRYRPVPLVVASIASGSAIVASVVVLALGALRGRPAWQAPAEPQD